MSRTFALCAVLLGVVAGCGGAQRPAEEPAARPVEVSVDARRVGASLYVVVTGIGRDHLAGERIEDPGAWQVTASAGGQALEAVVNGSAKIERRPNGDPLSRRWDVVVKFSVGFAMPVQAAEVAIAVAAPGQPAQSFIVDAGSS
ncbi:MAG TPA: hypothetical protein VFG83_11570 [Kofleriaceae bacterium]|nr:hypothetical protein [Kofleriaceae bacterium]